MDFKNTERLYTKMKYVGLVNCAWLTRQEITRQQTSHYRSHQQTNGNTTIYHGRRTRDEKGTCLFKSEDTKIELGLSVA